MEKITHKMFDMFWFNEAFSIRGKKRVVSKTVIDKIF